MASLELIKDLNKEIRHMKESHIDSNNGISETSRAVHLSKLYDCIGYVIATLDDTTALHDCYPYIDSPVHIEDLRVTLGRLHNAIPDLQLKDQLSD